MSPITAGTSSPPRPSRGWPCRGRGRSPPLSNPGAPRYHCALVATRKPPRGPPLASALNPAPKLAIIGLDCAEPSLVFGRFRHRVPHLRALAERGIWGRLRSCDPPITVPAWMCMMSGRDPGTLGFTGFRNRADRSYEKLSVVSSLSVKEPLLWDRLGRAGRPSVIVGVPQTWPPRPVNGCLVTGFLTPSADAAWTHPPELAQEILREVGEYPFDIPEFRTDRKDQLRDDLFRTTDQRFAVALHLLRSKPWDLFMAVEMGTDRAHHGFWKHMDPAHPRHEPGNPWERVIEEYYAHVDARVGELLAAMPAGTAVMVVSDHGATALRGGICINEWLVEKGYLRLHEYPSTPTKPEKLKVDWPRTLAWGEGGYYGRVFLNVKGREPQGALAPEEYEPFRDLLAREMEAIPDPQGRPIGTRVLKPDRIYRELRGIPPDLMAYFGDLRWRSVGTVGSRSIHSEENDTGPDDANHDFHGIFILAGPEVAARGEREGMNILDVAPTALELLGEPVPPELPGKRIAWR